MIGLKTELAKKYLYRSPEAALAKALGLVAEWPEDLSAPIKFYATDRKHAGTYVGFQNIARYKDKTCTVSMEAGDIEIGLAVRAMLAKSTISGKPVEM